MAEWPGADRRRVPLSSPTYAVREPLARWLAEEARTGGRGVRVLDVGCGVKPYYPFFEPYAAEYVGVDVVENPAADLVGPVEALPVEDARFDVVLASQMLEHCDDPAQAVRELRRVVAPSGRVLASTHGVQVYHPSPNDLWRWTHAGLERLFAENGEWSSLSVRPGSGTTACIGMLLGIYIDLALRRARVRRLGAPLVAGLNRGARALDRRAAVLREPGPGTLFANFHVVARP
jgi:SAM-dependent methyltransferase